jgi:hypothetical protein
MTKATALDGRWQFRCRKTYTSKSQLIQQICYHSEKLTDVYGASGRLLIFLRYEWHKLAEKVSLARRRCRLSRGQPRRRVAWTSTCGFFLHSAIVDFVVGMKMVVADNRDKPKEIDEYAVQTWGNHTNTNLV